METPSQLKREGVVSSATDHEISVAEDANPDMALNGSDERKESGIDNEPLEESDGEIDDDDMASHSEDEKSGYRPSAKARGKVSRQSTVSDGGDLADALYESLSGEFNFAGNYYYCSTDSSASNPGLTIDGLGAIGLPLSDRDAKSIISRSKQAPFGKGDQTVVDTTVRDTWEIGPTHVSFQNPDWHAFIEKLGSKTIPDALGVGKDMSRPRCVLHKLLLYQPGSHFLPHQDTYKAEGMFATVVVVLPSRFEGGEVHVSHAQQKAVLETSKNSAYGTSVLAWYTDVVHEVKPITAGYRLALSYNLIHTSKETPQPSLPDLHGDVDAIRRVFRKWKESEYNDIPSLPVIAYLLSHKYSKADLKRGLQSLKGSDAHKIVHLLPIAKECGFVVCLAHLTTTVSGVADDWGQPYDYDDDDEDEREMTPRMEEVCDQTDKISNLVRISEGEGLPFNTFQLSGGDALVPREPFEHAHPDWTAYEGYMGNESGSLEHWYERSVLVLFDENEETNITISINGIDWAAKKLRSSEARTGPAQQIAKVLLDKLVKKPSYGNTHSKALLSCVPALLSYAASGKDFALWKKAFVYCPHVLDSLRTVLNQAIKAFELNQILLEFSELVKRAGGGLQRRYELVQLVQALAGSSAIFVPWLDSLLKELVSSYTTASVEDIPALVWISETQGIESVREILGKIVKRTPGFKERFDVIEDIQTRLGKEVVSTWVQDWMEDALTSCAHASAKDVQTLMNIGEQLGMKKVMKILDNIVKQTRKLQERFAIVGDIEKRVGKAAVVRWTNHWMEHAISSYSTASAEDVPTIIWIGKKIGLETIRKTLVNNILKHPAPYTFLVALTKALHKDRVQLSAPTTIPDQPTPDAAPVVDVAEVVQQCVLGAVTHWDAHNQRENTTGQGHTYYHQPKTKIQLQLDRICELVDLCFDITNLAPCATLLTAVLQAPKDESLYLPLVRRLKAVLAKHDTTAHAKIEPFKTFFKTIISIYLSEILGAKPQGPKITINKVGCGCADCNRLDDFLGNAETKLEFRMPKPRRTHLEQRMQNGDLNNVISYDTIRVGSPHRLVVIKRPRAVAACVWAGKVRAATSFVESIVKTEWERKAVMGNRWNDVVDAIEGKKAFVPVAKATPLTFSVLAQAAPPRAAAGSSTSKTSAAGASTSTAAASSFTNDAPAAAKTSVGVKRKHRDT